MGELGARKIVECLRDEGFEAYYAGGCVRDRLLGINPHDYDVATNASPEQVQRIFPRTLTVGAQFGVVIVLDEGEEFQVATFRADGVYIDGRHPEGVIFTTAEGDALRRDFTVNGLFYDPVEGRVIDYVGGKEDLQNRILRAIGDPVARFHEDKLRLLRGVRFAATLGFDFDPATWEALCAQASTIHQVSAERIREELIKIFTSPTRVQGFDLLDRSGLLQELLPELAATKGCEQPPEFHPEGDVFVHTRLMLSLLQEPVSATLAFAVLFHDIGKPPCFKRDATGRIRFNGHEHVGAEMTEKIMSRLRFSNHDSEDTVEMVRQHMAFKDVQNMRIAKLKRFMARRTFPEEMELHRVDCLSCHGMLDNYDFLRQKEEEFAHEPLIPPRLVNGDDLVALGWKPGPVFKLVLDAVQNRQLENAFATREDAIEWVKHHYPSS